MIPRQMWDEREVARRLGVSVQTLRNHRYQDVGIPYIKFGRRVLYNPDDVSNYLDSCRVDVEKGAA